MIFFQQWNLAARIMRRMSAWLRPRPQARKARKARTEWIHPEKMDVFLKENLQETINFPMKYGGFLRISP